MFELLFEKLRRVDEIGFAGLKRKQQTITKLFPSFPDRVKKIASAGGLRLKSTDEEKWTFKVHSGTIDDVWYDIYIRFKNIPTTLEKLVMDRRLWVADRSKVDMSKLAREFLNTVDVQMSCSCPADLYYGGHYIRSLGKYDAKYSDKELRSPRIKNPKQLGCYCKHLENVMRVLPFYATTASRWLADFYGDEMSEYEEKAKTQFGGVKKAAVALGAKKEEEAEKVTTESKVNESAEKLSFLGTCKDIVDLEDTEEVSALACIVEDGKKITKDDFLTMINYLEEEHLKMLNSNSDNFEFYYNDDKNIAWFYDIDDDVEYFYGLYLPI